MAAFESSQIQSILSEKARIRKEQEDSAALVEQFIRVANICLDNGGDCSFEWPRFCTGWALPAFCNFQWLHCWSWSRRSTCKETLEMSHIFAAFGQESCSLKVYTHSKHTPLQGKWTMMSVFYPRPLCHLVGTRGVKIEQVQFFILPWTAQDEPLLWHTYVVCMFFFFLSYTSLYIHSLFENIYSIDIQMHNIYLIYCVFISHDFRYYLPINIPFHHPEHTLRLFVSCFALMEDWKLKPRKLES